MRAILLQSVIIKPFEAIWPDCCRARVAELLSSFDFLPYLCKVNAFVTKKVAESSLVCADIILP